MFRNKLLEIVNPFTIFVRGRKEKRIPSYRGKNLQTPEGVKYPGGIVYYPRPGEKEPEITPTKLLRVERKYPLYGVPWFLKRICYDFKLGTKHKHLKENFVVVVKNIPEVNAKLWKIKHLVQITPITFPYGEPTINDVKHTQLHDSGVCVVTKEIKIPEEAIEERVKILEDKKRLINDYKTRDSRMKWLNPLSGGF